MFLKITLVKLQQVFISKVSFTRGLGPVVSEWVVFMQLNLPGSVL